MQRHVAETTADLNKLRSFLEWIDLTGMEERSDCTLAIPLLGARKKKVMGFIGAERASSDRVGQLLVHEVANVSLEDEAHIGSYDIDQIYFDQSRSAVVLRSGFPMTLTVFVKRLHVVLELD